MKKEESINDNSFGVGGVIFGVLGILFSSITGVILGIIGLTFSLKQKKIKNNKWAKAGFILNIISIVLGIIVFIYALKSILRNPDFLAQIQQIANAK